MKIKSSAPDSKRTLSVSPQSRDDVVIWQLQGANGSGQAVKNGFINTTQADAVKLAVAILQELAPDKLNVPKISDHPVGTFLRNSGTGELVCVTEWDERFAGWRKDQDTTSAVREDGSPIVPFDDGTDPKYRWEVVEVKAVVTTSWEVVE